MSEVDTPATVDPTVDAAAGSEAPAPDSAAVDAGTYELLRARLSQHARDLATRAGALNERRLEHFGVTTLEALAAERIRTANNCVPRDIAAVGDHLVFGYNVFIGLRSETAVADVLSLHTLSRDDAGGFSLQEVPSDDPTNWLNDPTFQSDFRELYTYYKQARLLQLRRIEGKLLMVFQIGERLDDLRVFRWAVAPGGAVSYEDNRGERDHTFPPNQDFEWTIATRAHHVSGLHPHVNILDQLFVETLGGDLTIKIENNTEDGLGIYTEPVDEADQSLADADIAYAQVGSLILVMVRPYKEHTWRHFVFNTKTRTVDRIDAIGQACQQLPEDHGIIFPGGYYLMTGETKTFAGQADDMMFVERIRSPNGEDVLYVFHKVDEGRSILLPYNVIRKEVANPIACHGYSLFRDGTMVIFQAASDEPTRVHPMQFWRTPFMSDEFHASRPVGQGFFDTIGNAELVRGISDALALSRLVEETEPSRVVYDDLQIAAGALFDTYHWLSDPETGDLAAPVREVQATGTLVLDEFERAEEQRTRARDAVAASDEKLSTVLRELRTNPPATAQAYVDTLALLRAEQGHLISLRELRYADLVRLDELDIQLSTEFEALAGQAIEFLGADGAFAPYHERLEELARQAEAVEAVADTEPVETELTATSQALEVLTEVVGALEVGDARIRTGILEQISSVLGALNRARALLDTRRTELGGREAIAEFGAEFLLFEQAATGSLATATTPEACDEQLAKLVLRLEALDARFGEYEDFGERLGTKRDDLYEAFSSRKQSLLDERQQKAGRLADAGKRLIDAVRRRIDSFDDLDAINTFFTSDQLIVRLRSTGEQLRALGEAVRADELDATLKATREDATRSLRDRADIYEEGAQVIRLGRHRFSVNTQPLDFTMVPGENGMDLLLTGTDYRQPVTDTDFLESTRDYWQQILPSETAEVSRAEFLATSILAAADEGRDGWSLPRLHELVASGPAALLDAVRKEAEGRYDEGYERGVHDHDAALLLEKLVHLHDTVGLLRYGGAERAAAARFWAFGATDDQRTAWARQAHSLARLRDTYGPSPALADLCAQIGTAVGEWHAGVDLGISAGRAQQAGSYLADELGRGQGTPRLVTSAAATELHDSLLAALDLVGQRASLVDDLDRSGEAVRERQQLADAWIRSHLQQLETSDPEVHVRLVVAADEAASILVVGNRIEREPSSALISLEVTGLLATHPRVSNRSMTLRFDELLTRTAEFRRERVNGFRAYQQRRHQLLAAEREALRLGELEPKVMSAFVRNGLIDQVYLPLIGDNLAKQLGALGEGKRTDQMGLLLLISPPGYGKTTLMEYVANRLGMVFVKINGPALGHGVTSVDPAEAPNATARQELEKLNFALEMASNVLLYVDDIQHTHPEFLQKFISLCDAQRRMEGVWRGRTQTYDLRGKRFAVCMAGNPYTESGEVFRIPDMLANRADTYNLGDVLSNSRELFELSYLENSLTANATLAPLTSHSRDDIMKLVRMAGGEAMPSDQLEHPWSATELEAMLSVLRKMLRVQEVLLGVNQLYISSAGQAEQYRTEPPFRLQGSYRNMNKLAERIVPPMNEQELEALIDDHYHGEAQTLTTGTEWNLLRLNELRGTLTPEEQERIEAIRHNFQRTQSLGGSEDDPMIRVVAQLSSIADAVTAAAGVEVEPPVVNVNVPQVEAPVVNVEVAPAEAPVVKVSVPDPQPAVVNITVPPAEPPIVNVTVPTPAGPSPVAAAPAAAPASPPAAASPTAAPEGGAAPSVPIDPTGMLQAAGASGAAPDPSLFGRRFFTAYLADDDLDFYWEVGDDGWAIRQLEIERSTGRALAAATLDEWRRAGETGPIGQGRQGGEFSERALDPAAPDVQTRPISGTDFELRWTTARRQLGLG